MCIERSNSTTIAGAHKTSFRLPAISIQPFSGKYEEWEEFRDIFEACFCSEAEQFNEYQKLLYLKSYLKEEPLNLIKNLRATNNSFRAALTMQEHRYQNKRKIFNAHIDSILNLPTRA